MGVQEKVMWNFHGTWLLTLEFPRSCHKIFAEILGVEACLSGISKAKVTDSKIPGGKVKKSRYIFSLIPLFGFFPRISICG